jgi:hypothetical protein
MLKYIFTAEGKLAAPSEIFGTAITVEPNFDLVNVSGRPHIIEGEYHLEGALHNVTQKTHQKFKELGKNRVSERKLIFRKRLTWGLIFVAFNLGWDNDSGVITLRELHAKRWHTIPPGTDIPQEI